jgi:hypothetical protein
MGPKSRDKRSQAGATTISEFLMFKSEEDLRTIRERIADQQAVVELLELRGYEMMLPTARDFLTLLEMTERTAQRRLEIDRKRAGS